MTLGTRRAALAGFCAAAVLRAQAPVALEVGKPVRGVVGGWEPRVYQIDLKAGQYLEAQVEEMGIAIYVRLFDPAGEKLLEVTGGSGTTSIYYIAPGGGPHRLEAVAIGPFDRPYADYQVTLVRLAQPSQEDRLRGEAFQGYLKACLLRTVEAYEGAARLFERASLPRDEIVALSSAAFEAEAREEISLEINLYEQILEKQRRIHDRRGEAVTLFDLGFAYAKLNQFDTTLRYDQQALAIANELKDSELEGEVRRHIRNLPSKVKQ